MTTLTTVHPTGAPETTALFGLMAEFAEPEQVVAATAQAYKAGYRRMDAYAPYAVEGLAEAMGFTRNRVPLCVLCGGLTGAATAIVMMWFSGTIHYPINVGGRPLFPWPSFVPITFELTILLGSFSAVLSMLGLNGLPLPYHPVFNVDRFSLASRDRFFLCIQTDDPKYDRDETWRFLESLGAYEVSEVPV
jgi:hypothetical protein